MLKIIIALIMFSGIIIFHEFGHFLLAKKNGIYVEEFTLGLGPTLIGIQGKETKYCLKLLPFGGSCMMRGEDSDDSDPRAFGSKTILQRFAVIFAGPFFNFILAFLLALIVIGLGGADPAVVGEVSTDTGAYEAGIRAGDRITKIDGSRIYNFREISLYNFMHNDGEPVKVTYVRDGETYETTVVRTQDSETGTYIFGVTMEGYQKQNVFGIIKYSILEVRYQIKSVLLSLKYLVTGHASLNDMSGPVGIVNMMGETYEESIIYGIEVMMINMLSFAILLSANLGVMNLLPIPALDGGRIVFLIVEAIRRKKIPAEKEGMVNLVAFALLLLLMAVIMVNDIRKLV